MRYVKTEDSPLLRIWRRNYPFAYWDNRINKINRYNSEDRLEAVYVLLQLADLYVHVFAARARNPNVPWFLLKEQTYANHISNVLEQLEIEREGETVVHLGELESEPEGLIGYEEIEEDWDVSRFEWIALDFLGCPAQFHPEEKTVEFDEEPAEYVAVCDAVVNFWRENKPLLNDFKHGFRVIPFDVRSLDYLAEEGFLATDETFEEVRTTMQEFEEGDEWILHFYRMETTEKADQYDLTLNLYRANLSKCIEFAELTLKLLHNLFGRGGNFHTEKHVAKLLAGSEEGEINLFKSVASFDMVMYKPGRGPDK